MARPEARFSKTLQAALEGMGVLVLPIETGPTNRGIPDLYLAKKGVGAWVELKVVTPKQEREPRTAIQIKRQAQMRAHGIKVMNAHDIRDSQDNNCGYRLFIGLEPVFYSTPFDLANAIIAHTEK